MNGRELKEARLGAGWTQQQAAGKLGVTQAYLSMAERGYRVLPSSLARKAVEVLDAPPTALPLREEGVVALSDSDQLRAELAALGYPGVAPVRLARAHLARASRTGAAQSGGGAAECAYAGGCGYPGGGRIALAGLHLCRLELGLGGAERQAA